MAEEVQINNVGGEGVASEVTLARLVSITEAMAKKAGVNPEDVTKKLKALADSTDKSIKSTKEVTKADKALASAGYAAATALSSIGGLVGGAVLSSFGALARSGTGLAQAFISGSTQLESFASQIPLVGAQLGMLAGLFDRSFASFQDVAGSGAAFNNSLTELRTAAAGARMPLEQFTAMVSANSDKLATFGGTATQGAQQIVALNRALGSNRDDLLNMGLNYQEINEALIDYQYLQRAGNRGIRLNAAQQAQQAEAAADYTKNLVTLGKLTGEDVKSQQEKIAQAQMHVAMQTKLASLSTVERAKMDALMADTLASGGQAAVDALTREFLEMPPMTEEAALYTSQFGENVASIASRLDSVYDSNVTAADMAATSSEYMAGIINGNAAVMERLGPGLSAAAAGLDGPMATIAQQLHGAGIQFTDFIDSTTGEVDQTRLLQALESARLEGDARNNSTQGMVSFLEALANVRQAFETQIISPLMGAVAPALLAMSDAITGVERDDEGNIIPKFDEDGNIIQNENKFADAIALVSGYITDTLAPGILNFIDAVKKDPVQAFKDLAANIGDAMMDIFLGPNTKTIMTPGGEQEVEIEREGGMLSTLGTALINGMVAGVEALWDSASPFTKAMVAGAALLFVAGGPLTRAMVAGVGSLMSGAVNRLRGAGPSTPGATPGAPGAPAGKQSLLRRGLGFAGRVASKAALPLAAGMSLYDGFQGFNADPNAGFLESAGNAGSSVLNGLTFGLLGRSSSEIAAEAEAANGGATDPTSATPTVDQPGAQLAMMMSPEQVSAMERIAAVDLSTFNTGFQTFMQIDIRNASRFAELDFTTVATGLDTLARIPDLQTNFNTINSLDAAPVRSYTEAMEDLVEVLERVNEVLAEDNKGLFGGGTGVSAADALSQIGTATSGTSTGTQQLNSTMQQVLVLLTEMRDLDIGVERNTRNIIGSNLAQGGVSNVSN